MSKRVKLARREREIVRLCMSGRDPKQIGYLLEISTKTVCQRLLGAASKMGVSGRGELKVWVLQHPDCLDPDAACERGLHPPGCHCNSPYCLVMRLRGCTVHPTGCHCVACLVSPALLKAA